MRPRRRNEARTLVSASVLLAIGLALAGLALAGCGGSSSAAQKDVSVTACRGASQPRPEAAGTIVNRSSRVSSYAVRIAFEDVSGNRVTEGADTVARVSPGHSAAWSTSGVTSAKGEIHCRVASVSRVALPGG